MTTKVRSLPAKQGSKELKRLGEWRRRNLGRLLIRSFRVFERDMLRGLTERGIDGLRFSHLAVLRNVDLQGTQISEIARSAGLSKQHVGPIVRELANRGILEVTVDPNDRRGRIVRFTEHGEGGLHTARDAYLRLTAGYEKRLGKRRMQLLTSLLARFVDELE